MKKSCEDLHNNKDVITSLPLEKIEIQVALEPLLAASHDPFLDSDAQDCLVPFYHNFLLPCLPPAPEM